MERRLAAILATDVVGYSRLIRADEEGTIEALRNLRADHVDPTLANHNGRIVKLMGDGMLAEFASVVDAVRAAVEMQQALAKHNSALPEDKRILFRAGINLGDIVIDGDDIQGDGVNVASRLEGLAEPGGICISGGVFEQVRDRLDLPFEDAGERSVKNIERPIRTYMWRVGGGHGGTPGSASEPAPADDTGRKHTIVFSGFKVVGRSEDAGDLAAAVTDAVTSTLANQTGFSLITDPDLADYQSSGTIQAMGARYRATIQLTDRRSGEQFAADRFDGDLSDLFEAQDNLAYSVASAIRFSIYGREFERAAQEDQTDDSTSTALTRSGYLMLNPVRADWEEALELADQVLLREPDNFMALALKATGHLVEAFVSFRRVPEQDGKAALAAARRAVQLNDQSDFAHLAKAYVHLNYEGDLEAAKRENERVVELNPNFAIGTANLGLNLVYMGDAAQGVSMCMKAVEATSRLPLQPAFMVSVALGYFVLEKYDDALAWAQRSHERRTDITPTLLSLATAAWHAGVRELSEATIKQFLALQPEASLATLRRLPFRNEEVWRRYVEGLRAAGLPE